MRCMCKCSTTPGDLSFIGAEPLRETLKPHISGTYDVSRKETHCVTGVGWGRNGTHMTHRHGVAALGAEPAALPGY